MPYVVEGGALHGFVLLQGVHLVQVAVSDEHSPVLRLVETVDLGNTKILISHPTGYTPPPPRGVGAACGRRRRKASYLSYVTGEQNSHELVFPLQLAGHQSERGGGVGTVPLLSATNTDKQGCQSSELSIIIHTVIN